MQQLENVHQSAFGHSQHTENGNRFAFQVTGNPSSPIAYKLASHFMDHARSTESGGWCAGKLASSMAEVIPAAAAWRDDAPRMADKMLSSGQWLAIDPDKTAPGDVVYRPHAFGKGGHIEGVISVGPNGYLLASDFHHTLKDIRDNNKGYYAGLTVMRYVGPGTTNDIASGALDRKTLSI